MRGEGGQFQFKRSILRLHFLAIVVTLFLVGCSNDSLQSTIEIDSAILDQYSGHYRVTDHYSITTGKGDIRPVHRKTSNSDLRRWRTAIV
jgi:hypothetical protein